LISEKGRAAAGRTLRAFRQSRAACHRGYLSEQDGRKTFIVYCAAGWGKTWN
jgi:hypothetical protein